MKTAVVTGAAGNLGSAVVQRFLEAGYRVIGTVYPGRPSTISHNNFEMVEVDLADEDQSESFIHSVIDRFKSVEVGVMTAGGFAMGKIAETRTADLTRQFELNVVTAYNIARPLFTSMMKQQYGRLFFLGSRPGSDMAKSKGMVSYGISKSVLFRIAELMNDEARGVDVTATMLVPSIIDTPQNRKSMPDADFSKWVTAGEIATVILGYCAPTHSIIREPVIKLYKDA